MIIEENELKQEKPEKKNTEKSGKKKNNKKKKDDNAEETGESSVLIAGWIASYRDPYILGLVPAPPQLEKLMQKSALRLKERVKRERVLEKEKEDKNKNN